MLLRLLDQIVSNEHETIRNKMRLLFMAISTVYHTQRANPLTVCEPTRLPQIPTWYRLHFQPKEKGERCLDADYLFSRTHYLALFFSI